MMHKIATRVDLALLQAAADGVIFNDRDDRKMLHTAGCEAVEVMGTSKYRKMFFDTHAEAQKWADKQYGKSGWVHCGLCGGGQ